MNHSALSKLEYDKIKAMLMEEAASHAGRALIEESVPSASFGRVTALLRETEEAAELIRLGASIPLSAMEGMEAFMELLGTGYLYQESELAQLSVWLTSVAQMKRYMQSKQHAAPTISGYAATLDECKVLRQELERCIRYGAITDQASPELAKIRRKLGLVEEQLKRRLDQAMNKYSRYVMDPISSRRSGRYVIPVRREFRKQVPGTVWDQSSSGQTLFIEPEELAHVQGEWDFLKQDEARAETAVLAALSGLAEESADSLRLNREVLAAYDYIFARGRLGVLMNGTAPDVADEPVLSFLGAKHPLLGPSAVPITVEIGFDYRQLMITGPNTGGKTAALKTIGLLTLMVQSGLLIPVEEGSRAGIFTQVLADVGDGQSLEHSLSTFSAHLTNVAEMLRHADERSLLLMDELAAGTDPGEGIALSLAILEELLERRSVVAATTHFNEIKEFARRTPGCRNARMAFDPETLQPLYRLEVGEAGSSFAFAIARKFGIPEKLVARAEQHAAAGIRQAGERMGAGSCSRVLGHEVGRTAEPPALKRKYAGKPARESGTGNEDGEGLYQDSAKTSSARPLEQGDCVYIHPLKQTGIVYKPADSKGEVVVQFRDRKLTFNHKRLSLRIAREHLYPADYDMDIVFESVENRKKRKQMSRRHDPDMEIITPAED
ncbi:DNA mismatch repair protein MutS [Paenibacillus sambharensis]|uniref:DNA mismatch repair protein MutS n=1 Tax=Paenibacillus sambharensis TaxID=1803190 RepID=A0A2W1LF56_9BACL|nr:DNA mismatch repair protein MutS [Paenibacillus sambharensis]PZD93675.1 DNA mismatch repair protein MutS [Paenibacillus sambharensis]